MSPRPKAAGKGRTRKPRASSPFAAHYDSDAGRGFWVIEHRDTGYKFEVSDEELPALRSLTDKMRAELRRSLRGQKGR